MPTILMVPAIIRAAPRSAGRAPQRRMNCAPPSVMPTLQGSVWSSGRGAGRYHGDCRIRDTSSPNNPWRRPCACGTINRARSLVHNSNSPRTGGGALPGQETRFPGLKWLRPDVLSGAAVAEARQWKQVSGNIRAIQNDLPPYQVVFDGAVGIRAPLPEWEKGLRGLSLSPFLYSPSPPAGPLLPIRRGWEGRAPFPAFPREQEAGRRITRSTPA